MAEALARSTKTARAARQRAAPMRRSGVVRISEVSELLGVSASTVRAWEAHGLLRPRRSAKRHRLYDAADVERIRDIKRLRDFQGLNIAAIKRTLADGDTRPAATSVLHTTGFGATLRRLRLARGLSVQEVSRRTGLAASFVSMLERTGKGGSAASLNRLAGCYGLGLGELLGPTTHAPREVVRAGQGRRVPLLGPDVEVEQLAVGQISLDCERWILEPGAESDGFYAHDGEEFLLVLEGRFALRLGDRPEQEMGVGDSIYFDSPTPHAWRNPGSGRAVVLWVNGGSHAATSAMAAAGATGGNRPDTETKAPSDPEAD